MLTYSGKYAFSRGDLNFWQKWGFFEDPRGFELCLKSKKKTIILMISIFCPMLCYEKVGHIGST
jgi:hypothetical protein